MLQEIDSRNLQSTEDYDSKERSHDNKKVYRTMQEAWDMAELRMREVPYKLIAYKCKHCHYYHIGHERAW